MDSRLHKFWLFASGAALIGGCSPALAQVIRSAPSREEVLRTPLEAAPAATASRVGIEGDLERGPCPLSDPAYAGIVFTLSGAEFAHLQGISPALLQLAYQAYVGKTVPLSTVCDIRDSATELLRRQGYLAAIEVPAQKIESGVVKFDVIVAKIVGFQVRGNPGKSEKRISEYLALLQAQPLFNALDAERTLLLMRDMPGYDIRLTLRPAGTGPGEMIGDVQVEFTPLQAEANANNFGARITGRIGGLAQLHFNGLLGTGDRTSLGFFATTDFSEQVVVLAGEELQIGHDGLSVGADAAYAWTRPDFGPGSDFLYSTFVAGLHARYPLVRSQARTISVSGGLDWIEQRGSSGSIAFFRDKLRVVYGRVDYDQMQAASIASLKGYSAAEPRWRVGGSLEVRQGLNILGATKNCGPGFVRCFNPGIVPPSFLNADLTAFIVRAAANLEFRPTPALTLALSPRAQFAPHALPAYEEFTAGNFTIGRGYSPSALSGDIALGIASEVRIGSLVPASSRDTAVQGYAFLDSAWLWDNNGGSTGNAQHLTSAGGGVRAAIGDRFKLDTILAVPMAKLIALGGRGDVRLLVNLTMNLLPWKRR